MQPVRPLNLPKAFMALIALCFFLASCNEEPIDIIEMETLSMAAKPGGGGPKTTTSVLAPIDKNATYETVALFNNLKKMSKTDILFGHQDDTKTGYGWANVFDPSNPTAPYIQDSDVQKITDAYPAMYGWDLQWIVDFYTGDRKAWETEITRALTIDAYNRGGVNTYSWHYHNPIAKEGIWWEHAPVEAVKQILPGGSHHEIFKNSLRELADYSKTLIGADGKAIPIIFRPFHEMNGSWFWWGKGHCTAQEYKQLYQFTVTYLRDELNVHNFLYAWSPDRAFTTEAEYLEYYPGDRYVDVVGMDNYHDLAPGNDPMVAADKLKIVSDYAIRKNKVAAFTETGLDGIGQADWFTQSLLPAMRAQAPEIAYVMLWSNTTDMYWTPYMGHPAENDFVEFKQHPDMIFSDRLPDMYRMQ